MSPALHLAAGTLSLSFIFGLPPKPFPPEAQTFGLPAPGYVCTGDCVTVQRKQLLEAGKRLYKAGEKSAYTMCGRSV